MTARWHILTPELPPGCGGVGDYTAQVAQALAQSGDLVSVYSPPAAQQWPAPPGIEVLGLPDRFGPQSMRMLAARLSAETSPSRLLVQYVPNVFGRHGANLPFSLWLRSRRRVRGDDVRVMFHEPYLYFRWRPDHVATAIAQRAMAAVLLRGATEVYASTDAWRRYLLPYGGSAARDVRTLPIPSAILEVESAAEVLAIRENCLLPGGCLVGHFGSYGAHITPMLRESLRTLLFAEPSVVALCTGAGSDRFVARMRADHQSIASRIVGTGRTAARDVSVHLQACDVMLQPYPDGVTTRRTSVMAGLANRRPVVTTEGALTESVWRATGAVALAPAGTTAPLVGAVRRLLRDEPARAALAARGSAAYAAMFDLRHTISALRGEALPRV